ncbi:hypothetical protein LSH36_1034g00082 [Paralvinella palmiformis]|uniref:lysozyme n=1 Tax=Paralvinella palmiformis TaxID=53620 RepID=A0AAD9MSX7_9ANNE|nr:hypothetical protein LSH36_1034g00082 [Paralvinella palmiformis]
MKSVLLLSAVLFVVTIVLSGQGCHGFTDECTTTTRVSRKASTIYYYSCGLWGWWDCTGTRYFITQSTIEICCDGYRKIGGRCIKVTPDSTPPASWRECTKDMACSERCIKAYMKRYGKYCTRGREPTCEDYARIHNGGPWGCRHQSKYTKERNLRNYWAAVSRHGSC